MTFTPDSTFWFVCGLLYVVGTYCFSASILDWYESTEVSLDRCGPGERGGFWITSPLSVPLLLAWYGTVKSAYQIGRLCVWVGKNLT